MKRLVRHPLVQAALARLLGRYLHFALRTIRWTVDGQSQLAALAAGRPTIVAFWHEHLPMVPVLSLLVRRLPGYRPTPVHALVSQHRDGRFIGTVIRRFGMDTVFGSTSRGGAGALRHLLTLLRSGHIIGITPDGPRGPRRLAAPGVAHLAGLSGIPVLPIAIRTRPHIQLRSWDRMTIPVPFGRGIVVCDSLIPVPRTNSAAAVPVIEAALKRTADQAERRCPA